MNDVYVCVRAYACVIVSCLNSHTVSAKNVFVSFIDRVFYLTVASTSNPANIFLIQISNLIKSDTVPRHHTAQLDMDIHSSSIISGTLLQMSIQN